MSSDLVSRSPLAIRTEHLGKEYRIRHEQAMRRPTLVEAISRALGSPISFWRELGRYSELFRALDDVTIEIAEGEIVGLIGRNGAGKSTLLKILSRITLPSSGRALIRGRVGSLLEVGTGFHPELTGRENIFLNGSFLGMRRHEIRKKFDDIVAFSEVGRFLDTPIKRYSSGMYVRLAFSVAAHLEPEILLVDEVLAVGDAAFQSKCLGKMGEVARSGRTVVFVSHNLPTIISLTSRCFWLDQGRVAADGPSQEVVSTYLQSVAVRREQNLRSRTDREGSGELRFTDVEVRNARGETIRQVMAGEEVEVVLRYEGRPGAALSRAEVSISFLGTHEQKLFHLTTAVASPFAALPSRGAILCRIPRLPLLPGKYPFNLFCKTSTGVADAVGHAGELEVAPGDFFASGRLPLTAHGPFLVEHDWSVEG